MLPTVIVQVGLGTSVIYMLEYLLMARYYDGWTLALVKINSMKT